MTSTKYRTGQTATAALLLILLTAATTLPAGETEQPQADQLLVTELTEPVIAPDLDLKDVAPLPQPVP
ncbi:MAG TPA: hypothetical protein ENG26_02245, partial [Gammaproteobacteria bacterium]|nr:hypothetical protein [Gammaproteobacteria bacterium]